MENNYIVHIKSLISDHVNRNGLDEGYYKLKKHYTKTLPFAILKFEAAKRNLVEVIGKGV